MKKEWHIFLTAVMFYTRLPCPKHIDHAPDYLNKATRYFPFIGWIVGAVCFAAFYATQFLASTEIAVAIALLAGLCTTGAFHEDGLADTFDGFGGGWSREKILDIMKDSRVGTYGAVALVMSLLIKFLLLVEAMKQLNTQAWYLLLFCFILYHSLARASAASITFFVAYARDDESSKSKPIAKGFTYREVWGVIIFGLLPLFYFIFFQHYLFALLLLPLLYLVPRCGFYFKKWLGGYTGDCLGAVEQMAEIIILFTFTILWKYL